jgi:hypothetical protein
MLRFGADLMSGGKLFQMSAPPKIGHRSNVSTVNGSNNRQVILTAFCEHFSRLAVPSSSPGALALACNYDSKRRQYTGDFYDTAIPIEQWPNLVVVKRVGWTVQVRNTWHSDIR